MGTNVPQPAVAGLAFEPATDALYYGTGDELYALDAATGAATDLGATGIGTISGLTFYVPEPRNWVFGAPAAVLMVLRRKRRGWTDA